MCTSVSNEKSFGSRSQKSSSFTNTSSAEPYYAWWPMGGEIINCLQHGLIRKTWEQAAVHTLKFDLLKEGGSELWEKLN